MIRLSWSSWDEKEYTTAMIAYHVDMFCRVGYERTDSYETHPYWAMVTRDGKSVFSDRFETMMDAIDAVQEFVGRGAAQ